MSVNTGLIWGRRDKGGKIKPRKCSDYYIAEKIELGAGTDQLHSALNMSCININDIGLSNPGREIVHLNIGQKKLGNSGVETPCPDGSFFSDAVIQHDSTSGNSANVQQIKLKCRNPQNQITTEYLVGKNNGKYENSVSCGPDKFFNEVLFTEGNTNLTGIGFNCFDVSDIVNDDGWRRLNCVRTKTGITNECGQYYSGSDAGDSFAKSFCTSSNNWMMPACVKWAENNSTDMDSFYTTRCKSLTTPVNPITSTNFITFKFPNGKYLGDVNFDKPVLAPYPMEFRIMDTGVRYEGDIVWEFYTVEDIPRYLQLYHYIDENANVDSSYQAVVRKNFNDKKKPFETGNPFQFTIRQMTPPEIDDNGEEIPGTYLVEKFGTTVSRDVSQGMERYPVYMGYDGDRVILTENPTIIEIENFNQGKTVCSCINAVDDLPKILVDSVGIVGAQAFCYSEDCVSGSGYKTEGQKREPCNQQLTICYSNLNILNELSDQGVNIGNINIDQNCGPDGLPSLSEPWFPWFGEPSDEKTKKNMRIAFVVVILIIFASFVIFS